MGNKSALQLEVEKEMGFEIDEDLFAYLEHYARRKLEVANKKSPTKAPAAHVAKTATATNTFHF